jgi:hypothetical protein
MSRIAYEFERQPQLISKSRETALPTFPALDAAINQLRILEPSLNVRESESGGWLLDAARSLAQDVLHADEFSTVEHDLIVFDEAEPDAGDSGIRENASPRYTGL